MAKGKPSAPVGIEETLALYGADEDRAGGAAVPPDKAGRGGGRVPQGRGGGRVPPGRGLRRLTRVLAGIACGLALVILAGTLYAAFRDSAAPAPAAPDIASAGHSGSVFTGIGRLRIPAVGGASSGADSPSRAVVVLSVVFPYPPDDRPFAEELAGKVPLFRRIIREYFGALSGNDLNPLDEQRAKDELLRRFNAELQLGKIELLLFNELMILE